jgi:hypothetical protein
MSMKYNLEFRCVEILWPKLVHPRDAQETHADINLLLED